jgi:hypothetical protein
MRTPWFQIISAILLLAVVTMFSGLASTAFADQPVKAEATDSNHCNPNGGQSCPLPCSTSVCPLCVCSIVDIILPIEIRTSFHTLEFNYPDVSVAIPYPFMSEIFHPPKPGNSDFQHT